MKFSVQSSFLIVLVGLINSVSAQHYLRKMFEPIIRHAQSRNGEVVIMNFDCEWNDIDKILLKDPEIVYNFKSIEQSLDGN
jgi:hypothetical protein